MLLNHQQNMETVHNACAPIFWQGESPKNDGLTNGTITFVSLNGRVFGITAGHVAEACDRYIAEMGKLVVLGHTSFGAVNATFTYHPHYPAVDLAVCNFDETKVAQIGVRPLDIPSCPIPLPVNGQNAAFGGFPGQDRANRDVEVDFDFFYYEGHVFEAEDSRIQITVILKDAIPLSSSTIVGPITMGGMSGGPILAYFERQPRRHLALVGIITRGFDNLETLIGTSLTSLGLRGDFPNIM